jgi:chromosome segregation ATPase
MKRRLLSTPLLTVPLLLASAAAAAQASPPPQRQALTLEALAARVEELERALAAREAAGNSTVQENEELKQRVAVLERQVELQQEDAATAKSTASVNYDDVKGVSAKWSEGA